MDKYGIYNITDKIFNYKYDLHYKNVARKLKEIKDPEECDMARQRERKKLSGILDVKIDINEVKANFFDIIMDENSAIYLWILYSKYDGEQNYIDKISETLMKENEVIRGGTNTYKMNGWMCHTLYAYQIANYNIPSNLMLTNFPERKDIENQISELYNLYKKLTSEQIFLLRIFTLLHDIGVIESVQNHPLVGPKYVEQALKEIGLNNEVLKKYNINVSLEDFTKTLKVLIKHHILITMLSGEMSDRSVAEEYEDLMNSLAEALDIKKLNSIILLIFAYGDIIAVDEVLMNTNKYNRIKDGFDFFDLIIRGDIPERNNRKVAVERLADIVGILRNEDLENSLDEILKEKGIDVNTFVKNMYNIKSFFFTSALMKTVNNLETTIAVFDKLFELITEVVSQKAISEYTICFSPDKPEKEFSAKFADGSFFECADKMITEKCSSLEYKGVRINIDMEKKELVVRII